jgi:hypothetical protein
MHREILRFAQNDKRTFSAACEAVPYKDLAVVTQALQPVGFLPVQNHNPQAEACAT